MSHVVGSPRAVLCGLGSHLPERIVTNAEVAGRLGITEKWIEQRSGVLERHRIAVGESTGDLAVEAGRRALESSGGGADVLVLATTTPDHSLPATAPSVADRLGMTGAQAFDINAGCTGFIYGLSVAEGLVRGGGAERVLLIAADTLSTVTDPHDQNTAPILADGAGAVVIRMGHESEAGALGPFDLGSDGGNADLLAIAAGGSRQRSTGKPTVERDYCLLMEGREVFKHAVSRMSDSSRRVVDRAGWQLDSVDAVIPHQANIRICVEVARRLGIAVERCLSNIAKVGNTSAASIPVLLDQAATAGALKPGHRVVLTAFGSGLTWGSTTLTWPAISRSEIPVSDDDPVNMWPRAG